MLQKIETLLKTEIGTFHTPKKLNRSDKDLKAEIVDQLEAGEFDCEMIDALAKSYPVYRYRTCITIHGNWPEISIKRIAGYKNVHQNANGSIEVRYSALDSVKHGTIQRALIAANSKWHYDQNSNGFSIQLNERFTDKTDLVPLLERFKTMAANIEKIKFYGSVNIWTACQWGRNYLVLTITPLAIPETSVNAFIETLSGLSMAEVNKAIETRKQEKEAERLQWKLEQEQRDAKALEKRKANDLLMQPMKDAIKFLPECNDLNKGILVRVALFDLIRITDYSTETTLKRLYAEKVVYHFIRLNGKGSFGNVKRQFAISETFDMDNLTWYDMKQVKATELPTLKTFQLAYTNELPKDKKTSKTEKVVSKAQTNGSIELLRYSDKAYAMFGNTIPVKDKLKELGGRFNGFLTNPVTGAKQAGWIFSATKLPQLQKLI